MNQLVQRESKAASPNKSRHRLQKWKEWSANELNALQNSSYCSVARLCLTVTPWTIACQVPLSGGFPRQEYWSGLPFPSPGIFPTQRFNSHLHLPADSLPLSHLGSPQIILMLVFSTKYGVHFVYLENIHTKKWCILI